MATASPHSDGPDGVRYRGEAVFIHAYDIAYDMSAMPTGTLLGQPLEQFAPGLSHRSPREVLFYGSLIVRLPPVRRQGRDGPVDVSATVKIFPVGAISVTLRVPFAAEHAADLVAYHDLTLDGRPLREEARELAERVRTELLPQLVRPVEVLREEEAYTVFCMHAPLRAPDWTALPAEEWLRRHRRDLAAVITQEENLQRLSDQEVEESTARYLSYYQHDLTVIDWDAAIVVDDPTNFDDILHIIELANVELAELEAYDRLLDATLGQAYRDVRRPRGSRDVLRHIREMRIDMAHLSDELSNITKFIGDWHLARLYQNLAGRFHLADWQKIIAEKLQTLDDLYGMFKQDQTNRWMMILEVTIVVLFIIDLVLLVLLGAK